MPRELNPDAAIERSMANAERAKEADQFAGEWSPREVDDKIKKAISAIKEVADYRYCRSLTIAETIPCLGWEAKVASGKFGREEYNAHKNSNQLMGEHIGLHEAIRILQSL